MNNNLLPVYQKFKGREGFLMLSHTSDPGRDTPLVLRRFSDSLGVDTKHWLFLTGRKDSLYRMARHSYKIDDPKNNVAGEQDDFLHTQFVALVNRKGEVVKIFDALKPSEMKELERDIENLLKS